MAHNSRSRIDEIERWFRSHEDGEFRVLPADQQSSRSGDSAKARSIIYTTKQPCFPRINGLPQVEPIATLSHYGLPLHEDLPFVRGTSPARLFIGDGDPPDILIFAWLREYVAIGWHGVSDEFLARHRTRDLSRILIPLSESEQEAVQCLPWLCPDFRDLLGEYCSSLLDDGFKIELEGATIERSGKA